MPLVEELITIPVVVPSSTGRTKRTSLTGR
jgi:hypothetical protein